jgi:hypothetical protein
MFGKNENTAVQQPEVLEMPEPREFSILMFNGPDKHVKGHEAQVSVAGALTILRGVQINPTQAIQVIEVLLAPGTWISMTETAPPAFSQFAIH